MTQPVVRRDGRARAGPGHRRVRRPARARRRRGRRVHRCRSTSATWRCTGAPSCRPARPCSSSAARARSARRRSSSASPRAPTSSPSPAVPRRARCASELGRRPPSTTPADDLFDRVMARTDGRGADVVCRPGRRRAAPRRSGRAWRSEGRYLPVGFNDDPQSGLTGRPLRKVSMGNFSVARRDARPTCELPVDVPQVRASTRSPRGRPRGARGAAASSSPRSRSGRWSGARSPWMRSPPRSTTTSSGAPRGRTVVGGHR